MKDLPLRELVVLKEIHLMGKTSDESLVRKFFEEEMIVDIGVGSLLLIPNLRLSDSGGIHESAVR